MSKQEKIEDFNKLYEKAFSFVEEKKSHDEAITVSELVDQFDIPKDQAKEILDILVEANVIEKSDYLDDLFFKNGAEKENEIRERPDTVPDYPPVPEEPEEKDDDVLEKDDNQIEDMREQEIPKEGDTSEKVNEEEVKSKEPDKSKEGVYQEKRGEVSSAVSEIGEKPTGRDELKRELDYYNISKGSRFISEAKGFTYRIIGPVEISEDDRDLRDVKFAIEVRTPAGAVLQKETDAWKLIKNIESGNFKEAGDKKVSDRLQKRAGQFYQYEESGKINKKELTKEEERSEKVLEKQARKEMKYALSKRKWLKDKYAEIKENLSDKVKTVVNLFGQSFEAVKGIIKFPAFIFADYIPAWLTTRQEKKKFLEALDRERIKHEEREKLREKYKKMPEVLTKMNFEQYLQRTKQEGLYLSEKLENRRWQAEKMREDLEEIIKESRYLTKEQKSSLEYKLSEAVKLYENYGEGVRGGFEERIKEILDDYINISADDIKKLKKYVEDFKL